MDYKSKSYKCDLKYKNNIKGGANSPDKDIECENDSNKLDLRNFCNKKEKNIGCQKYDYDPTKCNQDENCEWDLRNFCNKKNKRILPNEVGGLIGSYLPHSNLEHKFILNSISANLESADKYAIIGHIEMVVLQIKTARENIDKIRDNISPEKLKDYEEQMSNSMRIVGGNNTRFIIAEIENNLMYARNNAIKGDREMVVLQIKTARENIDKIRDNISPEKLKEYEDQMSNSMRTVDSSTTSFIIAEIEKNLTYTRNNAIRGDRKLVVFQIKKIRENIDKIRDNISPEKLQYYEEQMSNFMITVDSNNIAFIITEIENSLMYARNNAFKGDRKMVVFQIKNARENIDKIRDNLSPEKIQEYENQISSIMTTLNEYL
jgi:Tfp pilus assembly protein FimT